ncbi:catecholate siderophore receptor Fiu [Methylotenera sp. L2L1]|uniref:catecholate siderophore receptor Fiu n=1 Tax=Methylotenera sp. L2L1 TaxID=1502770 RepID=UPI00055C702E|nr:catecholate siderophore receptor Fiu [Methylotenera sp. L2L1]
MSYIRSRKHNPARIAALVAATLSFGANAATESNEAAQLPEVNVTAAPEVPFKADESANNKFTKPLLDTTQTVQVIKKELLREQGVFSLTDALRNTPGITIQLGENGNTSAGDTFSMRGFNASNQLFVDGIRDLGAVSRDVFNLEQVEVVKGPAGADIGRGAASGYINLISKLPSLNGKNYATVGYGTADKKRATVDLNQVIGETTAVRLNALAFDGNVDKRDKVDNQNFSVAPSIAFGLGGPTRLYLYSQHVRQDNTPDGGIPTVGRKGFYRTPSVTSPATTPTAAQTLEAERINAGGKVDRENYYGSDNDYEKVEADMITAKFEHDLTPTTTIRNISRYGKTNVDRVVTGVNAISASSADANTWTLSRSRQRIDRDDEILVNQTSLNTIFDVAGFKNSFAGGLEFMYESQKSKGFGTTGQTVNGVTYTAISNPNANLYNPNSNDVLGIPYAIPGTETDGRTTTAAIYAFDTVDLTDKWQVNAGLRYEHYNTRTTAGTIVTSTNQASFPGYATGSIAPSGGSASDNLLSWKTGVLFKPATNGSIYASYATSYTPPGSANFALTSTANNQNNGALDPQKTDNIELGTKWDLLNNQLNVSAAIFRTENDKQTSFNDLLQPEQIGRTRVTGLELLAIGQLTEHWQLSAGVTKLNAKALDQQSYSATTGITTVTNGVRWTPDYSATLWSQYQFNGFTFGGGARYMGEQKRLVTVTDPAITNTPSIESYVVADAMVAYAVNKNLNLRLNVYNIFDKEYVETLNNGGSRVRLGLPRSGMLTAEFMF